MRHYSKGRRARAFFLVPAACRPAFSNLVCSLGQTDVVSVAIVVSRNYQKPPPDLLDPNVGRRDCPPIPSTFSDPALYAPRINLRLCYGRRTSYRARSAVLGFVAIGT